jgi:MFS family permease
VKGTLARTRDALRSHDFRRLFAIRLVSQSADGFFQAALVASVVFNPEKQSTALGFAIAIALVSLPFSAVGPFTGVFIDRWSRRGILVVTPWIRAAVVWVALLNPRMVAVPFYVGVVLVFSVNRFYLATAQAVVPRLVPTEDLLMANSIATVGGTVALLAGVFVGGWISDVFGNVPVVVAAGSMWLVGSLIATRITTSLTPHHPPADAVTDEIRRVAREFVDGIGRLARTPRAVGPITSISIDQFGQGILLVLSLFVFRERYGEGVGSFSNLIGAGGVGVLVGILTVGKLEERLAKERIVAGAFGAGGVCLLALSLHLTGLTLLLGSFAVGLTFAWKKIPVDTMVQEAIPDGYRGRVFAAYDVSYNLSRVIAAFVAIAMRRLLGPEVSVALIGLAFVLYAPVLPRWIGRAPELVVRFYEGGRAEEWPRTVVWGGVEEHAEVQRSWTEERDGERRRWFRLGLEDGTVIEVSGSEGAGTWRLERELT